MSNQNNNNCHECQKPLGIINKNEEWEYYKYIILGKDWNGNSNNTKKNICLNCWNKNQEQYKQDWEDIEEFEETWNIKGNYGNITCPNEAIQAKCKIENCNKKFDCKTAEKHRHKWSQNDLSSDDHEELNKNPAPVKTMEDLVKQWMVGMSYQKLYFEGKTMKIKKTDGKTGEKWGYSSPESWDGKLEKWLEEQPNKEIEVKAERERERERESKIKKLRKRIAELEAIADRTAEQEAELTSKKQELAELEKQQEGGFKKYLPWIIGGGIVLVLVIGVIAYFWGKNNKKKYYEK